MRSLEAIVELSRYRGRIVYFPLDLGTPPLEATYSQIGDIDNHHLILHVKHGKGGKDRFVPLPKGTLLLLRDFCKTHRNKVWLFPAPGRSGTHIPESNKPLPIASRS